MLPGWVCFRGARRNTRAKHYSETAGMLPWNALSPAMGPSNLHYTHPAGSRPQAAQSLQAALPLLWHSVPGEAQLPELTAPQSPPRPGPSPAQVEMAACGSDPATARPPPTTFFSSITSPKPHVQRFEIATAPGVPFPQEALPDWMSGLPTIRQLVGGVWPWNGG